VSRVLVVEDEPSILRLMVRALTEAGLEVIGAMRVADVRAINPGWRPDALVVDLGLPNGTVADVANMYPGVPSLIISGRMTGPSVRVDLPKPFAMSTLTHRVEQLLGIET